MKKSKKYLPHISLRIPAKYFELILLALFIVFLLFLFVINISYVSNNQSYLHNAAVLSLKNPNSPIPHITLAKFFYNYGLRESALFEFNLAQNIMSQNKSDNILGASIELNKLITELDKSPDYDLNQYNYWKSIIIQNRDYEDAYLNLINLAIKLNKINDAISYLNQLKGINPHSEYINTFTEVIDGMQ